ncbi:MAG: PAS domain-containing sensor histidine kinase, partial [Pedobacter sp.]
MDAPSRKLISDEQSIVATEQHFRALVTATSDMIYRMSADWLVMLQLDGRGFLPSTNVPNTDWIAQYIHPLDKKKL